MRTSRSGARGFTIAELMTVVAIIGLLMGLLLPALAGVRRQAKRSEDLNRLRQVGLAWISYANMNGDALLPGYLPVEVQDSWGVSYRFPDNSMISPAPDYLTPPPDDSTNLTGAWPWRLASYFDHDPGILLGHREGEELDAHGLASRAWEVRTAPAYAYNGVFLGGWYVGKSRVWINDGKVLGEDRRVVLVRRTLASVRRPTDLITFAPAAIRQVGLHRYKASLDDPDGLFIVTPPNMFDREIWGPSRAYPGANELVELYGDPDPIDGVPPL